MIQAINTTSDMARTLSGTARRSDRSAFTLTLEPARTAAPVSRKRRVNWADRFFNALWMALMLSCAGGCVCRLLWAVTL